MKSAALSAASRKASPELLGDSTGEFELIASLIWAGWVGTLLTLSCVLLNAARSCSELACRFSETGDFKVSTLGLDFGESENVGGGGTFIFLNVATTGFLGTKFDGDDELLRSALMLFLGEEY